MAATPSSDGGATDAYATAKANVRDTIKWLVAAFASLAAVVVAGSPFSGLGTLTLFDTRFSFAVGGLMVGFVCVTVALYMTLRLLRPDALFVSDLANPRRSGIAAADSEELEQVNATIDYYKSELLPPNYQSVNLLLAAGQQEQEAMQRAIDTKNDVEFNLHKARHAELTPILGKVLEFAVYLRLYQRLMREVPALFALGAGTLVCLAVFAWAANPSKSSDKAQPTYIVIPTLSPEHTQQVAALPHLAPVLFATGRAEVTPEGLSAIAKAREFLRSNTRAVLLLRAHTDTVASAAINRDLARRRGEAVRQLLLERGGVAVGRVFVAELPEVDLPDLTRQETAALRNRSVEFLAVLLPAQ